MNLSIKWTASLRLLMPYIIRMISVAYHFNLHRAIFMLLIIIIDLSDFNLSTSHHTNSSLFYTYFYIAAIPIFAIGVIANSIFTLLD